MPRSAMRNATGLEVMDEPRIGMDGQLSRFDPLFAAGIGNEAFGQFRTFAVSHHPAHHVATEDVEDHVEIEVGPLRRSQQFRDVPAPELVRTGSQQLGFRVSRMDQLVATLPHLALAFQNPVHGANRAMIAALIEKGGVNRSRRAVLKSFFMQAGQDRFPFRGNKCPRHMPRGGGRRTKTSCTLLPVEGCPRKAKDLAGCFYSGNWRKILNGGSHGVSVSASGIPSSMATFFWTSITISALRSCSESRSLSRRSF